MSEAPGPDRPGGDGSRERTGTGGDGAEREATGLNAWIRNVGSAPNGALWMIFLLVAGGTAAVSWDWGEVAWPGVIISALILLALWLWSRSRGWPFFPWNT